ncbi:MULTISPECIES: hypothetical protein [unclassified Dysgonomonas]|nr:MULTISPECIES: hypothetical protein [unclassified Dysgonomonas]MBD8346374.1 hypothetical protein [Dysgonomonas sp. HGC4]MBF0574709.1 hypothetical protein [Dysgonomonas sp. GY617]
MKSFFRTLPAFTLGVIIKTTILIVLSITISIKVIAAMGRFLESQIF